MKGWEGWERGGEMSVDGSGHEYIEFRVLRRERCNCLCKKILLLMFSCGQSP